MLLLPAVLALALSGSDWQPPRGTPARRAQTVTVTVLFTCEGERAVNPWEVRLAQGDEIDWVLDERSDVQEFEIEKKRALGRWPFDGDRPRGRKGEPARGRNMKEGARGKYSYDIVAQCPTPDGGSRRVVIDPDIIID